MRRTTDFDIICKRQKVNVNKNKVTIFVRKKTEGLIDSAESYGVGTVK